MLALALLGTGGARAQDALQLRLDRACAACAALGEAAQPAAEEAILSVQVNLEAKGEHLVLVAQDGDILVRDQDFAALGLGALTREPRPVAGVPYVSLRALPEAAYTVDMERLVLAIRVEPRALGRHQVLDLAPQRRGQVLRPPPAGSFLNYNFTHTRDPFGRRALDGAGEVGMRFGEYLLTSDGYSREDPLTGERHNTRLSSTVVRDRRETLERLALGDFLTVQPGPLGSSLRLGGVSLSRRFSIDPYYVRFPGQVVAGTAALPSEVFVYSNGVLVRRERIGPGGFELQNLVNLPGLQTTEVVVRDVLGNEQRIVDPYYYSESLLRPGLDEYSFDAGFERRNFGVRSNDYGEPGFSAFYRRGLTPWLTAGGHAESLDGRTNLGPSLTFGLGLAGVSTVGLAFGHGERGDGAAFSAAHTYHSPRWSGNVALRMEERDFARAAPEQLANRRYDFAAALSYALTAGSSMSVGVASSAQWDGFANRSAALGYRVRAGRDVYLSATARHVSGEQRLDELVLTLSWSFDAAGERHLASLQAQRTSDGYGALAQLSGGNPEAEGLVYRVSAEAQHDDDAGSRRLFNPALQWNARRAVLRAESFRDSMAEDETVQLGVQGGIAAVGGQWALTRPVNDSFAIVKVDQLAGVRVYANNQPVGTTDASGTVFVPRLASYFENPVAIEDRDLPVNYLVPQARFVVSPALRSGALLDFRARAVTAVAGRLVTSDNQPLADAEGFVNVESERREILTARDGSFYVENVPPGVYQGAAGACRFTLRVPKSAEVVTELGEVACE
jgi:outer membrane usher protein FimD/PapC